MDEGDFFMVRRKFSAPVKVMCCAVLCWSLYLLWLAAGAYLIDTAAVGEEAMRRIVLSGGSASSFMTVLLCGGKDLWKNAALAALGWTLHALTGLVLYGMANEPDALVLMGCFVLGAAAATYVNDRFGRWRKRRKKRRGGK